jgi:hypothetical protein
VRDFAYETTPGLEPLAELFDPRVAIREHDFQLWLRKRTVPIPGKILRRLLDIGWVGLEEADKRWTKLDWAELISYDSRPAYPWAPLNIQKPSDEERKAILQQLEPYPGAFEEVEQVRHLETLEEWRQQVYYNDTSY